MSPDTQYVTFTSQDVVYKQNLPGERHTYGLATATLLPDGPYDVVLTMDDVKFISLANIRIEQGLNSAVMLDNRCENVSIINSDFAIGVRKGFRVITIKGGCKNIFIGGVIHNPGRMVDVIIGDWSDSNTDECEQIDLSYLRRADGKPVRVWIGNARNINLGNNCVEEKFGSFKVKLFWWFKRLKIDRLSTSTKW